PRSVPHHARPRTIGSAARHVGRSPDPADGVRMPRSASIAITVLSVATRIVVMMQTLSTAVAKQAHEACGVEPFVPAAEDRAPPVMSVSCTVTDARPAHRHRKLRRLGQHDGLEPT